MFPDPLLIVLAQCKTFSKTKKCTSGFFFFNSTQLIGVVVQQHKYILRCKIHISGGTLCSITSLHLDMEKHDKQSKIMQNTSKH